MEGDGYCGTRFTAETCRDSRLRGNDGEREETERPNWKLC